MRGITIASAGAGLFVLSGCCSITLWDGAPSVEAKEVVGADVDGAHVLLVDLRFSNGEIARCRYALTGKAGDVVPVGRAEPPLPSGALAVVPPPSSGGPIDGDRFAVGDALKLSISMHDLQVDRVGPTSHVERPFVRDLGLDWREPSNYGRVLLTPPAIAIDLVTSPFQIAFFCWVLVARPGI